jgi:NAD-dependent SIR2 family protein deacetylase
MARAVFVLGAGASAPFGVPTLMRVFQDREARRYLQRDLFLYDKLNEIFWSPRGMNLDTSHLSLSIEEILTLVRDYEYQAYGAPPLLGEEAERFKRSLYVLIKKAIYDGKSTRRQFLNPIIDFARHNFDHVTWASFNWDCIFEASYYYSSGPYAYNRTNPHVIVNLISWRNPHSNHLFLKLHGGINWWYENEAINYLPFGMQPDLDRRWQDYEENMATGSPVILEPSYYKYEDPIYQHLKIQWQRFVEELFKADVVIILGYSLPEADTEARRVLSIGFQSNTKARYIIINRSDWACDRYKRIFGTARSICVQSSIEDVSDRLPELILGGSL